MSNRRARQAAETRSEILGAARSLFAARGYAATSIKAIAERADVSVQTVYDSVGSKADLVLQLNDHIDDEAGVAELAGPIPTETAPRALVEIPVRITCALIEKCGDIVRAGASGSAADPALHRASAVGFQRHADGAARVAARLGELDALRDGLSVDDAGSTIAVLTDSWFAVRLVDEYGWTIDRLRSWGVETLVRAVLKP